jgi:hypothetical protein
MSRKPTPKEYANLLEGKMCVDCGKGELTAEHIEHYPHDSGWAVDGYESLQWLFVVCPRSFCGYQNSLHKLGFDRPVPKELVK